MATTPIASLVACSWCGLLAERGPICDACGSPVAETTGRTSVLRVPEARDILRDGLRSSRQQPAAPARTQPAAPAPVNPQPSPSQGGSAAVPPVMPSRRPAARWLSLNQASVMSGVPERTLRGWASSRTPEDVPVREGDPRFLLVRTPGVKLPDGLWMLDGQTSTMVPAAPPAVAAAPVDAPTPAAPVLPVPRPDVPAPVVSATPVTPVARATTPPPPPRPQPPVRAPILAAPVQPAAPVEDAPAPLARRGQGLSDSYLEALLAEDALPETWGFDSSPGERKVFRRHKVLTAGGILLGFAGVAELIDFVMGHLH